MSHLNTVHFTVSAIGTSNPSHTSAPTSGMLGTYVPRGCVYFEGFQPKSPLQRNVTIDMSRAVALAIDPDGRNVEIYLTDGTVWAITTFADSLWTRAGLSPLGQQIQAKAMPKILAKLMGGIQ